jgi:HEPN domain-containing protein
MTKHIRIASADRQQYDVFLEKARQFLKAAKKSFESGDYNASAANSVHACISAADAVCVKLAGKRAAGDKHSDAVNLFRTLTDSDEHLKQAAKFSRVLAVKSLAEYEARLVYKGDSEAVLHNAEKFVEYALSKVS